MYVFGIFVSYKEKAKTDFCETSRRATPGDFLWRAISDFRRNRLATPGDFEATPLVTWDILPAK